MPVAKLTDAEAAVIKSAVEESIGLLRQRMSENGLSEFAADVVDDICDMLREEASLLK